MNNIDNKLNATITAY